MGSLFHKIPSLTYYLLIRPWHITVPILLALIVVVTVNLLPNHSHNIMLISSAIMQCVGVATLLWILNKNIYALRNSNLLDDFKRFIQEFPLRTTISSGSFALPSFTITGSGTSVRIKKQGNTIEERLIILEAEIEQVRQEGIDNNKELINTINKYEIEFNNRLNTVDGLLKRFQDDLNTTVIGDYRWQIFSVIMILLGLLLSMIPMDASS